MAEQARAAWQRLVQRLGQEPADRRVAILHRPGEEMLLDGYLQTRCVELAVHLDDLVLSVGARCQTPEATLAIAVDVLVAAARDRHGDQAVLHALARRERDGDVHRHTFRTRTEARIKIATWITDFYNTRRLHSVCGFKSPIDYEREYRATLAEGLAA
ncbi:hypothetical protein ABTX62_26215 [Streptomyces sp. NPDC096046]|uniref:hypothetical protein n=1 Tax=Streptomyces sp. NPDC096046 TaxID=3155542 RepID=UPI003321C85B